MHSRMAGELGANIIKTDWCGPEGFKAVATGSLAPVAVAGGSALEAEQQLFDFAGEAIASGTCGLMFGRDVFSRPDHGKVLKRLAEIVHAESGMRPGD